MNDLQVLRTKKKRPVILYVHLQHPNGDAHTGPLHKSSKMTTFPRSEKPQKTNTKRKNLVANWMPNHSRPSSTRKQANHQADEHSWCNQRTSHLRAPRRVSKDVSWRSCKADGMRDGRASTVQGMTPRSTIIRVLPRSFPSRPPTPRTKHESTTHCSSRPHLTPVHHPPVVEHQALSGLQPLLDRVLLRVLPLLDEVLELPVGGVVQGHVPGRAHQRALEHGGPVYRENVPVGIHLACRCPRARSRRGGGGLIRRLP